MAELILPIIAAVLGSEAVVRLIIFFVERKDKKHGIAGQLLKLEKDSCRTQMLLLLSDYPEEKAQIMTLAEHYFGVLHGNWYMTTMFNGWLQRNGIPKPAWFNGEDSK